MSLLFRNSLFCLAVILAAQTTVPAADTGGYKALIVGNSAYPASATLINPVNDAQALAERLGTLGFSINVSYDANLRDLDRQITRFVQDINKGDVALFYYSGHGFQIDGENFLVPIDYDVNVANEIDAKYQAFPLSRLLDLMASRNPRLTLIILDACRTTLPTGSRGMKVGWAAVNGVAGSLIAFATSPGKTASDNPGKANGLFTQSLLQYLGRQDLTIDQLFSMVRMDVFKQSGGNQIPTVSSSLLDTFTFRTVSVPPGPTTSAVGQDQRPDIPLVGTKSLDIHTNSATGDGSIAGAKRASRTDVGAASGEFHDPQAVPSLLNRARASLELGDVATVLRDTMNVLELTPKNDEARRLRSRAFIISGAYDKAIEDLSLCIQNNSLDVIALYYRSVAEVGKGDFSSAWEDSTAAIVRAPNYADAYLSRSVALLASGRFREAIEDSSQALKHDSNLGLAYTVRGNALRALGQAAAAEQDFLMSSLPIRTSIKVAPVSK